MSVNSVSSNHALYQVNAQATNQKVQQNLSNLGSALQSGNLTGAQQALTAFEQVLNMSKTGNPSQTFSSSSGNNKLSSDLSALENDLKSQNTTSAQADFNQLIQDLQSVQKGHHHHHSHYAQSNSNGQNPAANATNSFSNSSSGGNPGNASNLTVGSNINLSA
ncbi:MAG: hypothetical protein ACHQYP_00300 [Nitrospiria bacterium]